MKLHHVFENQEPEGELFSGVSLRSLHLFGALSPDLEYPTSCTPICVLSDRFDLMLPPVVGNAILECAMSFKWTTELDAKDYRSATDEIQAQHQITTPLCIGRSPYRLWRKREVGGVRWMTLQRLTANRASALELLRIAACTNHFPKDIARVVESYHSWLSSCGGFQLAVLRQWEDPAMTCDEPTAQRLLNDWS